MVLVWCYEAASEFGGLTDPSDQAVILPGGRGGGGGGGPEAAGKKRSGGEERRERDRKTVWTVNLLPTASAEDWEEWEPLMERRSVQQHVSLASVTWTLYCTVQMMS